MNILFLGCLYSENQKDLFLKNSRRGYQFAAQNLQEALLDGLLQNGVNLTVLTIPSLSTFPKGYKKPFVKESEFLFKGNNLGKSIGYRNISFFKKLHKTTLQITVDKWNKTSNGSKYVVIYGLHLSLMKIALKIKKQYSKVKLCIIVPDLPRFMGCNKYYKMLGFKYKAEKEIYKIIKEFDFYVFLAEPMAKDLGVENMPYTVVEGIYSAHKKDDTVVEKDSHKVILYTGNLNERYGILNLLDAFSKIDDPDYRLWIRGDGSTKEEVLRRIEQDSRIVYFNKMPSDELYKLQKKAMLLVNPVLPTEEFTHYFFPSKTMDYLASETPILMYKLDCLSSDYYNHMYFFNGIDIESMKNCIKTVCDKNRSELDIMGKNAADFVKREKGAKVQTYKILELINGNF